MHEKTKADSPSGTAKEIGKLIAYIKGKDFGELAEFGRDGK